ncbi:hypothetical protein CAAN3_04S02036 [[Candida] anglica]
MQFLSTAALFALAACVAADSTFTLTASGGATGPVGVSGSTLIIGGSAATFTLVTPDGLLKVGDEFVHKKLTGINELELGSQGEAAHAWGYEDNKLRFGVLGTEFFACDGDAGTIITDYNADGKCKSIELNLGGDAPAPSSEAPAPSSEAPAPSSEAPAPSSEAPAPSSEAPAPSSEAPAPSSEAPAPSSEAPAPSSEAPVPTTAATSTVTNESTLTSTVCTECTGKPAVTSQSENGAGKLAVGAAGFAAVAALVL